jgi:DNA-binding transcriptional regulator YiaG
MEETKQRVRAELSRVFACGEEQALIGALRQFVEDSKLSIPRIAHLIGVSAETLRRWVAGTTKPRMAKLLEIKSFLAWHVWRDEVSKQKFS